MLQHGEYGKTITETTSSVLELLLELFHRALHQLLGVFELLEDQRDVHLRLIRETFASAVGAFHLVAARKSSGDRSRHDVGDADVVVTHFLHQRFTEGVQSGLRRTIRSRTGERVFSRKTTDVDDVSAASPFEVWQRRMTG